MKTYRLRLRLADGRTFDALIPATSEKDIPQAITIRYSGIDSYYIYPHQ